MSITDELRAGGIYRFPSNMRVFTEEELTAIADRIDAEHQKATRELNDYASDSVLLPCDADGVPIHIGDYVETLIEAFKGQRGRVEYLALTKDGWEVDGEAPSTVRHYHAPTVEDVLREFVDKIIENTAMYVAESLDADERDEADLTTIAEYAAKLRLVGDE